MITFPNAKINIGLDVLNKRDDGYHNIESLFYPIPLKDALEIIPTSGALEYSQSGISLECNADDNLVVKAFRLLQDLYHLPNVKIHLHKNIPFGAGLGGGSADAAFALKMLNEMFELALTDEELEIHAATLGADCAFFIKNKPQIAKGIGEVLTVADIDFSGKYLVLLKPDVAVPTANAYKYITPSVPVESLESCLAKPIDEWRSCVKNDFETSVFLQYPELSLIKEDLYNMGAIYAAMSGSGSSVFGIFNSKPEMLSHLEHHYQFMYRL